jgi:hypothetical protein
VRSRRSSDIPAQQLCLFNLGAIPYSYLIDPIRNDLAAPFIEALSAPVFGLNAATKNARVRYRETLEASVEKIDSEASSEVHTG